MTLDLLVIILPYLSTADGQALFEICLSSEITESKDNAVQKRGYKVLGKLIEQNKVSPDPQQVLQKMDSLLEGLAPAAKKVDTVHKYRSKNLLRKVYRIALPC